MTALRDWLDNRRYEHDGSRPTLKDLAAWIGKALIVVILLAWVLLSLMGPNEQGAGSNRGPQSDPQSEYDYSIPGR